MKFTNLFAVGLFLLIPVGLSFAQDIQTASTIPVVVSELENNNATETNSTLVNIVTPDPIVVPGNSSEMNLLKRDLSTVTPLNFFAYFVSKMVESGLSIETIVLTLMIPILATLVTFTRNIIGLPSMDTLVVISFSIALIASNILVGSILLVVTLVSSIVARLLFKKIKIMQLPKITLSMFFVTFSVLTVLGLIAINDGLAVESISVVPVLLFIIMSERIVRLQFDSNPNHAWSVVFVTLTIGITGYYLMLSETIREFLINYPETVLLVVPINIIIGKYFGLRLMEKIRFADLLSRKK